MKISRKAISDAIVDLRASGYLDQLRDKYWRFAGECSNIDGRKYFRTGMPCSVYKIH